MGYNGQMDFRVSDIRNNFIAVKNILTSMWLCGNSVSLKHMGRCKNSVSFKYMGRGG